MKRNGTGKILYVIATACLICAGCTGTNLSVHPDPAYLPMNVTKRCGAVAVKETPADHVYPPAGNLVPGFAIALKKSGLAEKVFYPARPDDQVDLTLDAKFDVLFDANAGANLTKSFFVGLTLFLLEPALWYDFDYNLTGKVEVLRGNAQPQTLQAASDAEISMKLLSLGETQKLEGEALPKTKESLYRQLLLKLNDYCTK